MGNLSIQLLRQIDQPTTLDRYRHHSSVRLKIRACHCCLTVMQREIPVSPLMLSSCGSPTKIDSLRFP